MENKTYRDPSLTKLTTPNLKEWLDMRKKCKDKEIKYNACPICGEIGPHSGGTIENPHSW